MDPIEEENDPAKALDEALEWFGLWTGIDFALERPIIIDSGRGMQAWIRLDDWACADSKEQIKANPATTIGRAIARRANGYWLKTLDEKLGVCHGCRIDTSVSDLPRVMRCPGTINVKTGRATRFVVPSTRVYTGLAHKLVTGTPKKALEDPPAPEGIEPGQPWQSVFPHLTLMAQNYLRYGQEEPGRHKVMWHTAKKFFELGVTRKEAKKAIRWANALRGSNMELGLDQIEHALVTAYGA